VNPLGPGLRLLLFVLAFGLLFLRDEFASLIAVGILAWLMGVHDGSTRQSRPAAPAPRPTCCQDPDCCQPSNPFPASCGLSFDTFEEKTWHDRKHHEPLP